MQLSDFPLQTFDKVRYADTDRQGHVNNAVFSSFLETGRVELLYAHSSLLPQAGCSFVIAALKLDFLREIVWPGTVDIGTGLSKIGNSSAVILQELYQNDLLVARAETVVVQVSAQTGKGEAFSDEARAFLQSFLLPKAH